MKFEYLFNTPLNEARETFLDSLKNAGMTWKTEKIPVQKANDRVLACAHYARRSSPHYLSCAMDGIAVRAADIEKANESHPVILDDTMYQAVDTGDPLPQGFDCVVMAEQVVNQDDGRIFLFSAVPPWTNVRQIGEDISMGDMIAPSYTRITPALIGALLAGGIFEAEVIKKPCAAIIPTGDEIVEADAELKDGDIPEYNSAIFSAMLSCWGAENVVYPVVPDKPEKLKAAVSKAAREQDMVIVIAGSSAGRDDYTASVLSELGELMIHGIAIKPGKPAILGRIGTVPFIGVPGYPVSGIIVMEQIVSHVVSMLTMLPVPSQKAEDVIISKNVTSSLKYEEFIRCRAAMAGGKTVAVPMSRGAGIVTGFAKASGIIVIDQDSEGLKAGAGAKMQLLKPLEDILNTLCVTGSHDPLIDEIADILIRKNEEESLPGTGAVMLASSHVGSMGAISAVRNGEAYLGGIHLLDTRTGEYNRSYIKKYFPEGGAVLVRGVRRQQGLMIAKGNPKNITGIADLPRLSYVNRQKGAGTRILLDYLLEREGINPADIYGYTKEEYTHSAVAAAIASGTADCGMGIYSAAVTFGLDFLYLWNEEYDFLVDEKAMEDPKVQSFLEVLRSEEFKERLEKMGGYALEDPGRIIPV